MYARLAGLFLGTNTVFSQYQETRQSKASFSSPKMSGMISWDDGSGERSLTATVVATRPVYVAQQGGPCGKND